MAALLVSVKFVHQSFIVGILFDILLSFTFIYQVFSSCHEHDEILAVILDWTSILLLMYQTAPCPEFMKEC